MVNSYTLKRDDNLLLLELKTDRVWGDGKPMTAQDVCFTIDAILNPKNPVPWAVDHRAALMGCSAPEPNRVEIQFHQLPHLPQEWLMFSLLPSHRFTSTTIPESHPIQTTTMGTHARQATLHADRLQVTPRKPLKKLKVKQIEVRPLTDVPAAIAAVERGEAHGIVALPQEHWAHAAQSDRVYLRNYDQRTWWFVALNTEQGDLTRAPLRQALDLLLDRKTMRQQLGPESYPQYEENPVMELISGPFVQSSPMYNRAVPVSSPDAAAAAALLHTMGWQQVEGKWHDGSGPVVLRLGVAAQDEAALPGVAAAVEQQLQSAGFTVKTTTLAGEWPGRNPTVANQFDLFIGQWSQRFMFSSVHHLLGAEGKDNLFGTQDPVVTRLLAKAKQAKTDVETRDAYHALHEQLAHTHSMLFLWKRDQKSVWNHALRGFYLTNVHYYSGLHKAYWEKPAK